MRTIKPRPDAAHGELPERRHPVYPESVQRAVREAAKLTQITQPASPPARQPARQPASMCCATHLLQAGYDIRTVQELLSHADVSTP